MYIDFATTEELKDWLKRHPWRRLYLSDSEYLGYNYYDPGKDRFMFAVESGDVGFVSLDTIEKLKGRKWIAGEEPTPPTKQVESNPEPRKKAVGGLTCSKDVIRWLLDNPNKKLYTKNGGYNIYEPENKVPFKYYYQGEKRLYSADATDTLSQYKDRYTDTSWEDDVSEDNPRWVLWKGGAVRITYRCEESSDAFMSSNSILYRWKEDFTLLSKKLSDKLETAYQESKKS